MEIFFPHSFSTILEVDYDTPYDRHIIIEDSHGRRFQKKRSSQSGKLEEPSGLGTRIFRRLSSKSQERDGRKEELSYELKMPPSQWRYPAQSSVGSKRSGSSFDSLASSRNVASVHKDSPR